MRHNNALFSGSIIIFLITFIVSNFIYDSYSVARVLVTVLFSWIVIMKVIFNSSSFKFITVYSNIFILLFAYAFLQSYFSPYISTEFEHIQQEYIAVSYILVTITFLILKNEKYSLLSYLSFISLLSVVYMLFFLYSFIVDNLSIYDSIVYYFKNIRFLNHLQTMIIPSLGLGLILCKKELYKTFLILLLMLNFMLVFETGGRGSFYSISCVYLFLYLSNFKSKRVKENILLIVGVFLVSLAVYIAIYFIFDNIGSQNHILDLNVNGRMNIYKTLFPLLLENGFFLFSIGFSSQDFALYGYLHPHNLFLYIFLGMGLFGLLVFIGYLFYYMIKILAEYFYTTSLVKKYLLIIFMAGFIHSLISGVYITPLTSLLLLYLFLMLEKYYLKSQKTYHLYWGVKFSMICTVLIVLLNLSLGYKNYQLKEKHQYSDEYKKIQWHRPGIMLFSTSSLL